MTTTSSWMMMLAVMYGMMPSANTASCRSAPPLNRLTSEYKSRDAPLLTWSMQLLMLAVDTFGVGTLEPSR
jgi:hypothetical protein